jgi:chromosome segregation protein
VARAQKALVALRTDQSDNSRDQYLNHALEVLKVLAGGLGDGNISDDHVKLLVHKAGRLLSHAARRGASELMQELQAAQSKLEAAMVKRDTATEHQTNITITRRSLEIDLEYHHDVMQRLASERDALSSGYTIEPAQRVMRLEAELAEAQSHLERVQEAITVARQRSAGVQASLPDARREAEVAVAFERAAQAQRAAQAGHERHTVAHTAAQAETQAARELAASWGIPAEISEPRSAATAAAAPAIAEDLGVLSNQLAAAEAMHAAKSTARADQLAEYESVSARHTELTSQITDLATAQSDLEQVIANLDTLIRSRFKENFAALSDQFSTNFERLFEGGSAKLSLEETADGVYGIQIQASPKGKRLSALTSLSGGERALTGVALLAAILRVNPSPFVVLDEIDAALDEANSGRLANILSDLSSQSQLIVISHNRQTMQAASVLFGVTLTDQHVSTVLSLRLDQATALAAR